jgi:hypothetical protein
MGAGSAAIAIAASIIGIIVILTVARTANPFSPPCLLQPVTSADEVKSAPSSFPADRDRGTGGGAASARAAADANPAAAFARPEDRQIESDARLAMQMSLQVWFCCPAPPVRLCVLLNFCVQELGGVYHASASDDFPLIRSMSEGGGGHATAAAGGGAWGRSASSGGGGGLQSFAAVVGSSFWDGEGGKGGRKKSGGSGGDEGKVPTPAVPQAPKGAWGKK